MFGYPQLIEFGPVEEETVEERLRRERSVDAAELSVLLISRNRPQRADGTGIPEREEATHKDRRD